MSDRFRVPALAGLSLLFLFAGAAVTFAHAQYASSTPASNATASTVPSAVSITFSEELSSIQIAVTGPHGSDVTTGRASFDLAHRTNSSVPIRDDGPGQYTVVWHNVSSDDGDPNDGSFVFAVAGQAPASTPTPTPAPQTTTAPAAANPPATAANITCVENGLVTPGIADVRVNTYCKRQAIREKYRGQLDEKTFNFDLGQGMGLDTALADAMAALKGG